MNAARFVWIFLLIAAVELAAAAAFMPPPFFSQRLIRTVVGGSGEEGRTGIAFGPNGRAFWASVGETPEELDTGGAWEESEDGSEDGEEDDNDSPLAEEDESGNDPLSLEYERWMNAVEKAVGALEKKQCSLQNELEKTKHVEQTVARANLITTYIYLFRPGVTSAVVQDWENDGVEVELTLDPAYESASAEAEALFQQARKLKRGSAVVKELLDSTEQALLSLLEMKADLEAARNSASVNENVLRLVQDRLLRASRSTGFSAPGDQSSAGQTRDAAAASRPQRKKKPELGTPASNVRKLTSAAGNTILVGRNRRGNEHLSFSVARGDDVWMHARGTPGAHVLILQRRGSPGCTDQCLQQAADLAAFYSDGRAERRVEVTAAEPKHLLKPRGAPPGAVKLREEWKVLTGFPDQVPIELKDARDASGLATDYRATDKAKLRKRNRQQQKEQQAKRRAKDKEKGRNKTKASD
jgi:hypothetical protein